jgi:integrase/recombinase XerD
MGVCIFRSHLAFWLQAFWEMRRLLGRQGENDRKILTYLDRFLMSELKSGETITQKVVEGWIKNMEHLNISTRINRISILRQFCLYLNQFDSRTCLVHPSFLPRRTRPAPYIYSQQEVCSIMAAARQIGPDGGLRPAVISTLIGLLSSTGLRIGEALKLTLADVDLKRRLLTIRETKFKKTRYVPLSPSTTRHLTVFLRQRKKAGFSTASAAPVFVSSRGGGAYSQSGITTIFLIIVRSIGLRGPKGERGPRLHDLRHSFAVNRLSEWYRQGVDLSAKLPLLTTYLGHTSVICTEVYLQATAELLEKAGKRFHRRFAIPPLAIPKEVHHAKDH